MRKLKKFLVNTSFCKTLIIGFIFENIILKSNNDLKKINSQYAEELKFEQAADIRNQIKFLRDGQFK